MAKEIVCWQLEFEPKFFENAPFFNGMKYSKREDAVVAVENLKEYCKTHYLSRMGRTIIHTKFTDNSHVDFLDKYTYRWVVIDEDNFSNIVYFGCFRKSIRLK